MDEARFLSSFNLPALFAKLRSNRFLTAGLLIAALTLVGKGIGFLVPVFIAWILGVSVQTDAFFFAYGVIFFLTTIFSGAVEAVLVPFIGEIKNDRQKVKELIRNVLALSLIILPVFTVASLICTWFLLPWISNFSASANSLVIRLLVEIAPLVVLIFVSGVFHATLNAYGIFWVPALSPGIRGITVMLSAYLLRAPLGVHSLTLGFLIAEAVRLILLVVWVQSRKLLSFSLRVRLDDRTRNFVRTSLFYLIVSLSINFNPIIDRVFASYAGTGAITLLEYARNLFYAVIGLIGSGFFVIALSEWSHRFHSEDPDKMKIEVFRGARVLIAVSLILTLLLFPFASQIVRLMYGRTLTAEQLKEVAAVFSLFLLGTLPWALSSYFSQGHLAAKNTKVLMQTAILTNVCNVLFSLILFHFLALRGLALSAGLTYVVAAYWIRKHFKTLNWVHLTPRAAQQ